MHGVDAFQFLMPLLWVSGCQLVTLLTTAQAELPAVDLPPPTALAFLGDGCNVTSVLETPWEIAVVWLLSDADFRFRFPNPALFPDFKDDVDSA